FIRQKASPAVVAVAVEECVIQIENGQFAVPAGVWRVTVDRFVRASRLRGGRFRAERNTRPKRAGRSGGWIHYFMSHGIAHPERLWKNEPIVYWDDKVASD